MAHRKWATNQYLTKKNNVWLSENDAYIKIFYYYFLSQQFFFFLLVLKVFFFFKFVSEIEAIRKFTVSSFNEIILFLFPSN